MVYYNSILEEGSDGKEVCKFFLCRKSERKNSWWKFIAKEIVLIKALHENYKRVRYKKKIPRDIEKYQIDYILMRHKFWNAVKISRANLRSVDDTYHNLIPIESEIKIKTIKKNKAKKRMKQGKFKKRTIYCYQLCITIRSNNKLKGLIKKKYWQMYWMNETKSLRGLELKKDDEKMNTIRKMKKKQKNEIRCIGNWIMNFKAKLLEPKRSCLVNKVNNARIRENRSIWFLLQNRINIYEKKNSKRVLEVEVKNSKKLTKREDIITRFIQYIGNIYDEQNQPK